MALRGRLAGLTPRSPGSLANDLLLLLWLNICYNKIRHRLAVGIDWVPDYLREWTEGIRTPDLLNAIEARSQLRYRPRN